MGFWKRSTPKIEAPPQPARTPVATKAAPVAERTAAEKPKLPLQDGQEPEVAPPKNGFDPYNSGAFDRRDTWGKVIRK